MTIASGTEATLPRRPGAEPLGPGFRQNRDGEGDVVAVNEIRIAAPRERVWEVLADAERYAEWVVGAQEVHDADEGYPAEGSALRHRSGIGPLALDDETRVLEQRPCERLVLRAKLRPLGEVEVRFALFEDDGGTRLEMAEEPVAGALAVVPGSDLALAARNTLALQRLKSIAES
jgi:uncharacterized protein YndB with AHSA1/START domain